MVRIGLSLYLMLVMAAGPWLCCCSCSRLARWLLTPPRPEQTSLAADTHACCRPQHAPDKRPEKPNRPHRPTCPCQEGHSDPSALSTLESAITRDVERHELSQSGPHLDFITSAVVATLLAGIIPVPCDTAASHFLTARDMLRAHHVLRC